MKKPVSHLVLLRCSSCKERFQAKANYDDRYRCPHCGEWMEYSTYKPTPAELKPIGPMENK